MTMNRSRRAVGVRLFTLVGAGAACAFAGCGGGARSSGFGDEGSTGGSGDVDGSDATSPGSTRDAAMGFPGSDATLGPGQSTDAAFEGGSYSDTTPDVQTPDGACTRGDAGPAPLRQRCAAPTTNECAGTDAQLTSLGVPAALLNGANGNGFDDDCDGLVDEGCACPSSGTTRDCFLVPATMVDVGAKRPVGWCTDNSKGSLDCAGGEFPHWSGTCRGAQPPYAHDVCASGDFNCDGLPQNSDVQDCSCHVAEVTCPTAPLTLAPYPDPKSIKPIDGNAWIGGNQAGLATGWKWTVVGGDCDNILPHPTFALYKQADATVPSARVGARTPVKFSPTATPPEYLATPGAPLMAIQAATGSGTAGGTVYPAFGLSGDYVVQGEFDLDAKHYVCTQKVQVRAPGIRAELCWDAVGNVTTGTSGGANDVDLHLARLQGITCASKGWDSTCTQGSPTTYEDCWWSGVSGCRDFSTRGPGWGYADSADSACIGWSSKRHVKGAATSQFPQGCTNPRLDRDNITCDPAIDDPNSAAADAFGNGGFCGPENVNLDNPSAGDAFVVGVNHFENHQGSVSARAHVNVYCGGARVVSTGYDPAAVPVVGYPVLTHAGGDTTGDVWSVATVKWNPANPDGCDVATVPSRSPDAARDGASNKSVCVDSTQTGAPAPYKNHRFVEATGALPADAAGFCKH
jgi:hypothetical protein